MAAIAQNATAELVLSDTQAAVLEVLCFSGSCTPHPLQRAGATTGTLRSLECLGLVEVRQAGARDPLYHLTAFGREAFSAQKEDPEWDLTSASPGGPLHEEGGTTMSAATETPNVEVKPDPKPAAAAAPKPAAAKPAATEKPSLQPLFDTLLAEAKKIAGRGHVVETKAVYTRVSQHGKAIVYINHPTSKSVRVEVPQKEGSGYDVVKITKTDEIPDVMKLVNVRLETLAAAAKAKAASKAPAAAPTPAK